MSSWILGIGLSHDASACLLRDGSPVVGVQLERLTGRKHDGRTELAYLTVEYCLEVAQIDRDAIVAYGVSHPETHVPGDLLLPGLDLSEANVLHVGHHLAHAYSAFAPSGFDKAAVLVIDGHGDSYYEEDADRFIWGPDLRASLSAAQMDQHELLLAPRTEVESIYYFERTRPPTLVSRNFMGYGRRAARQRGRFVDVGIGANYKIVSSVLFGKGDHSGKVMGWLRMAQPAMIFQRATQLTAENAAILNDLWRHQVRKEIYDHPDLASDHQWSAGLAAYIQRETEELVALLALEAARIAPELCMAGGVSLNATANGFLERKFGIHPFVQPASSDAGLAIGAAYAAHQVLEGSVPGAQPNRDSWGKKYAPSEVHDAVCRADAVEFCPAYNDPAAVAKALSRGAIVGWFEGGSEFGPRALGHRSILADPRTSTMRGRLNLSIKRREWFRPFGPVVLEEEASSWFETGGHSRNMTSTTFVLQRKRQFVPAIVHVDGSARIQLLRKGEVSIDD